MTHATICVLSLERNQDFDSTLFRFERGSTLRFVYGPSLLGETIKLFMNYPEDGKEFQRKIFQELKWSPETELRRVHPDTTALYSDLQFNKSGSFRYYFRLEGDDPDAMPCGSGYFICDPLLRVSNDGSRLSLYSVQTQTVLSKCLGHIDSWKDRLIVSKNAGYNVIHFTPIQELGASNSAYSLKNQLQLNPSFGENVTYENVKTILEEMRNDWGVLSITDIVLNHTANETPWLKEHPETGYNMTNSPHLRPAFILDRVLHRLTVDVSQGKFAELTQVTDENHLNQIRSILWTYYLPSVKIQEMFQVDVRTALQEFRKRVEENSKSVRINYDDASIHVIQDEKYRRLKSCIDFDRVKFLDEIGEECQDLQNDQLEEICDKFKRDVESMNQIIEREVNETLKSAVKNVISAIRYERLQSDGPKIREISESKPLVTPYFTCFGHDNCDLKQVEELMYDEEKGSHFLAHNGWVMNSDPLSNFAAPGSDVYLRRELIAWSDSVKLRYGSCPSDCPFLWEVMGKYVEKTAEMFDGIRLDNCHSTPLEVAEHLIDSGRRVRPELYVIAELFTSSEDLDNIFVNRLGINSLIRESMACHDSHELGRLVYRYGGDPVGAFSASSYRPLQKSMAHAIFFDMTHDNQSCVEKRSPYDLLASSAVISMSACATGSNRGYDELVPHHIHVVNESRLYTHWSQEQISSSSPDHESQPPADTQSVSYGTGLILAKRILNELHSRLSLEGYSEIFVDQVDSNVIAVTRHNPLSLKSVVLVARTCFTKQEAAITGFIRNITIAGKINHILFEGKMIGNPDNYSRNSCYINGIEGFVAELKQMIPPERSAMVTITTNGGVNQIKFEKFTPSSVIAFDVSLDDSHLAALSSLKEIMTQVNSPQVLSYIENLDLLDLNYVLFRCESEEKDEFPDGGAYSVPGFTKFNYCGLSGLMYYWRDIRSKNDLGHPICGNLRDGDWLPSYVAARLKRRESTKDLGNWFESAVRQLSLIPRYMIPRYFDVLLTPLYSILIQACVKRMSGFIKEGSKLSHLLVLGGVALSGFSESSPLPPLSLNLPPPVPSCKIIDGVSHPLTATIAAGFPHFSTGYMRNWGRDTFISLRGLLLVTGRYAEARNIILAFSGCMRHGLIPNLLDRGIKPRYNCRDAVWFWLQSIKDYCHLAPQGWAILSDPVRRLYPTDDADAKITSDDIVEQPLHQVMQEALLKHFKGINFMERNWGLQIDEQMTQEGFHVTIGVNRETGFVFGGNEWNCGTWMDKMGSSAKAGNRGKPSSPRDGSAVELVGLVYSITSWLKSAKDMGHWPYEGVNDGDQFWSWQDWSQKIRDNFEGHFWVGLDSNESLANHRNIYKDTYGARSRWQDFQLRPNFVVAMSVAPEMFDGSHARLALNVAEEHLLGPLGMKTLDATDWNYCGDYFNSDDSANYKTAHGFNYHQGPEWLWPLGYYLRARLIFAEDARVEHLKANRLLRNHYEYLERSSWMGLPELTNSNGSVCQDSCHIQAWSHSCLLDYLFDAEQKETPL